MIKHYLKNALKALSRNRFVTFINIFGISFTLLVMTLVSAFFDLEWGTDNPNENKYRTVLLDRVQMLSFDIDTIYTLDSAYINDVWVYDTLDFKTQKGENNSDASSSLSISVVQKYLSDLKESDEMCFSYSGESSIYLPSGKLSFSINYADQNYWKIYPYQLIAGRFYNESDVEGASPVVIITKKMAKKYFGDTASVLGKSITFRDRSYEVIGLVNNPRDYQFDLFTPYTHLPEYILNEPSPMGNCHVSYLAKNKRQIEKIKSEIQSIATTIEPYKNYTEFNLFPQIFAEKYATNLLSQEKAKSKEALQQMRFRFFLFSFFFVLLPILNLLNINLSRILDRKSEIGIRKSFGANSMHIFYQFLLENILLSLFSGLLALITSYFLIRAINHSEVLDNALLLNPTVILYGLLASVIFGFLFGVLPAISLSKMNIVASLKN